LIPPYLLQRLSLLARKSPVDNSQNPLYKAQIAGAENTSRSFCTLQQA
jgi:hypothetical protein